jgi:hypothetical protein
MSLIHSPSVVTNGLVLYTDMSNTQKSWKGQPTTNYVANADTMAGWNNYSNTANGTPAQFVTQFGTTGYRMDNVGSWNGVYKSVTVPSTGTYTFSAWIKWIGGSSNVTGGAVYISGWGGGDSASATNRTLPGQWQRISITLNCTTTSMTFYLICWGGTNNADNSSWEVTMPQIEASSYVTPFVNGSRSNTQAIRDLTNNNTITATSLTYAIDGTFSFNGSSNYLSIPNTTLGNGNVEWTVSCWMKTTTTTNDLGGGSILSNISGGPVYSMLGVNSGKIVYWTYQGGWVQKLGVRTVNDNNWHMLTWVNYSNNTMDMYVDGILDVNVANSTSGNNNPVDVIGRSWAGYFPGSIATVSRYTRSLSAAEVQQNFQALRGRYGI